MELQRPSYLTATASFVAIVILSSCQQVPSRVHKGTVDSVINQKPTVGPYIIAIGLGGSDPTLPTDTQRKALARDAAIVKAQYEMLSMIKGVHLKGGVKVEQAIETDSILETSIMEAIRGAEITKSEFTSDNGCVVTMRIPKFRLEKMMGVQFQ